MEPSTGIREFLTTRRARITPQQAGVVSAGGVRRVPGLRREEVARLAGVSVEYYTRLERGRAGQVSETVLDAISRALQLDDIERAHLFTLARPASPAHRRRPMSPQRVRPGLYRLLDTLDHVPAMIQGRRMDVLASNKMGRALFADFDARPHRDRNMARYVFLDAHAPELLVDWERSAGDCVAHLHLYAGRHPDDPQLTELIGELSLRSPQFRHLWGNPDVVCHGMGTKRFHHPLVGDLTLDHEVLGISGDPDQALVVYTPEPASPSAEALNLLGSWTGTPTDPAATPHRQAPATDRRQPG
ncbi:helix-turn-helix transcriptional regulator [Streptomyces sp. NPDC101455]|uniref:helix-turn-helix transcriptional regulator n=1 Tax=Streptomyces sp. NPDC101455 TaxID=3366142 RepID=UPI00381124E9